MRTEFDEMKTSLVFYRILTLILIGATLVVLYVNSTLSDKIKSMRPMTKAEYQARELYDKIDLLN